MHKELAPVKEQVTITATFAIKFVNKNGGHLRTFAPKIFHVQIFLKLLKHVKAWLKPNLHKISKTEITLPRFGIICAELAA